MKAPRQHPLRRAALIGLSVASPLLVLSLVMGGPVAEWLFTILVPAFPVLLIALSAGPRDERPATELFLLALGLLLIVSAVAIRLLSDDPAQPWLWGLPASTVLMGLGLGLLPLLLVGWRFAVTHRGWEADLARLNREHGEPHRRDSPERVG